jgi:hypothetical protein
MHWFSPLLQRSGLQTGLRLVKIEELYRGCLDAAYLVALLVALVFSVWSGVAMLRSGCATQQHENW